MGTCSKYVMYEMMFSCIEYFELVVQYVSVSYSQ